MTPPTVPSVRLLGIGLVLLSALGLAAQNVLLRLFFAPSLLFGQIHFGGWISPQLSNVVLLLALRMATMTLLLASIAPQLYPDTFKNLGHLPKSPRLLRHALGSGLCLFLGLTLLYLALSQVAAGIAIATFFIYPAVTVLLAWLFFHQRPRPSHLRWMLIIFVGVTLITLTSTPGINTNPVLGSLSALGAGLSFGLYGILAETCLQSRPSRPVLHPVPFSLLTFGLVAGLASLTVLLGTQTIAVPPRPGHLSQG
jgi:drug/metabolite transporter (DMT)-like permease